MFMNTVLIFLRPLLAINSSDQLNGTINTMACMCKMCKMHCWIIPKSTRTKCAFSSPCKLFYCWKKWQIYLYYIVCMVIILCARMWMHHVRINLPLWDKCHIQMKNKMATNRAFEAIQWVAVNFNFQHFSWVHSIFFLVSLRFWYVP